MSEMFRVAAPGGKIILVTWCHRPLKAGETLAPSEQARRPRRRAAPPPRTAAHALASQVARRERSLTRRLAGESLRSPQKLLDDICAAYYLPAWCSVEDYRKIGVRARSRKGWGDGVPVPA